MILVDGCFLRDDKLSTSADISQADRFLVALADGMGGHNSGDVASSDALHSLQFFFKDLPVGLKAGDFNETICEWLTSINHTLDAKGRAEHQRLGMGTTLVALAYYGQEFYWMNCGDSRLYRLHEGTLKQITTDHSLSNLMGNAQHSNVITNCIGGGCKNSYIDLVQCTSEVQPGDLFLLCSDGLSDMLSDTVIEQMLIEGYDAEALCHAAEEAGGFDNVSAAIITINPSNI
jgi:protein phosphatase